MVRDRRAGRARIGLALIPDAADYSVPRNLEQVCRLADRAGRLGCDLVCFEEAALGLFADRATRAVSVSGPEVRRLAQVARDRRMYVAVGLMEKRGRLRHNSVALLDRAGRLVGVHRKLQLTNDELRDGITPGDRIEVFETDFGRVGFIICYDSQFPEVARTLAVKGADLIVCPHVGGAVGGDLLGRATALVNAVWTAAVGRYCSYVCTPRGETTTMMRDAGKVLAVDCALRRPTLSINPGVGILCWRTHNRLERRPEVYGGLLGPPVVVECKGWPLYTGNPLTPGPGRVEFDVVNHSSERQAGRLRVEFPARFDVLSDERVSWFIHHTVGASSWRPRPHAFAFDLMPGCRARCVVEFRVPEDADGYFLARLSGRTHTGERVLWERRLERFDEPLSLLVPRVDRPGQVARRGAAVPLAAQFMGGPARSRTEARIARDASSLMLHLTCHRYGPWQDDPPPSPDSVEAVLMPDPAQTRLYRCTVARTGEVTTQVREGGHPIEVSPPAWTARVERHKGHWRVLMRLPFREFGGEPRAGRRWRFNLQRAAVVPDAEDRLRPLAKVVSPPAPRPERAPKHAVEWATWNTPYGRIDRVDRLGWIEFR